MKSLESNILPAPVKAVDGDDLEAMVELGLVYYQGETVERDYAGAMKLLLRAGSLGSAEAQYAVGLMYVLGQGTEVNYREGLHWLKLAAGRGYAKAQYNLGLMYYRARGVPLDYVSAYAWVALAASSASGPGAREYADFRNLIARRMNPTELAQAKRLEREWGVCRKIVSSAP
ncbi:tetratricopeptide repeat protein [Paludibaculum fermentans]|uniref:tetratricopeptide repeat protein n=1 Tax=Paludibaculum fermentans TaxID=1473598 RepID=UPI003EBD78C7